jgi:hypothetical protein
MPLTHLLKPITINKLEVKNRILRTGHGTYYGRGSVSDDFEIGYLEGGPTQTVSADTVVLVTYNQAQDTIFRELGGGTRAKKEFDLKIVGDAHSPRDLLVAIREGHMAGRYI